MTSFRRCRDGKTMPCNYAMSILIKLLNVILLFSFRIDTQLINLSQVEINTRVLVFWNDLDIFSSISLVQSSYTSFAFIIFILSLFNTCSTTLALQYHVFNMLNTSMAPSAGISFYFCHVNYFNVSFIYSMLDTIFTSKIAKTTLNSNPTSINVV